MDGRIDGWVGVKVVLSFAYSNQTLGSGGPTVFYIVISAIQ
jgi:hypothetical protein